MDLFLYTFIFLCGFVPVGIALFYSRKLLKEARNIRDDGVKRASTYPTKGDLNRIEERIKGKIDAIVIPPYPSIPPFPKVPTLEEIKTQFPEVPTLEQIKEQIEDIDVNVDVHFPDAEIARFRESLCLAFDGKLGNLVKDVNKENAELSKEAFMEQYRRDPFGTTLLKIGEKIIDGL